MGRLVISSTTSINFPRIGRAERHSLFGYGRFFIRVNQLPIIHHERGLPSDSVFWLRRLAALSETFNFLMGRLVISSTTSINFPRIGRAERHSLFGYGRFFIRVNQLPIIHHERGLPSDSVFWLRRLAALSETFNFLMGRLVISSTTSINFPRIGRAERHSLFGYGRFFIRVNQLPIIHHERGLPSDSASSPWVGTHKKCFRS